MEIKRFYKNQTQLSIAINQIIDLYLNNNIDEEFMIKGIRTIFENNKSKIIKEDDYTKVIKQKCGKRRLHIVSKIIGID